jgi:hypothetical protein
MMATDLATRHLGNTLCPVCHAIVQMDRSWVVEPHTVLVIGDE